MKKIYRVYDKKQERWLIQETFLGYNGELYVIRQSKFNKLFKNHKITLLSQNRYVYQFNSFISDKSGILLYEGDIVKLKLFKQGKEVAEKYCQVAKNIDGRFILLCYADNKYYGLEGKNKVIERVGNIFENKNLLMRVENIS